MRALSVGATGMLAQQLNVEVIAHNIANLNTTAYTRRRAEFQDLLYQNQRRVGSDSSDSGTIVPTGVQIGLGVKTAAVYRITEQGNLTLTENELDVAINGEGYFEITLPNGDSAYTRAGAFQLSDDGTIVTVDGFEVSPALTVPQDAIDITIDATGQVLVSQDGQTDPTNIGQLQLTTFQNEGGLIALGDNLFQETTASGGPNTGNPGDDGFGRLQQGFLETSNVNVVEEITNLISAQRAYEMNSKVIETSDQMLQTASNIR
ncbi:MAG: flagellar basal-body rod protein FlgG [Alphaproteobacteria bacterium]|nr:flagellar basal-body rod protein FlgG [Alphaproteobacteria bacterium]